MKSFKTHNRQSGFFGFGFGLGLLAIFGTTTAVIDANGNTDDLEQATSCESVVNGNTPETTQCTELVSRKQADS